ncbi:MAG TPA: hypothetical protein VK190_04575 [Pseudoneobacillus sp.]|nr:hypothetical protein [Pseudoneobacillus sp.]
MDNKKAIELQRELLGIVHLMNIKGVTDARLAKHERLINEFSFELKLLPPEGKRLNQSGYLIPWEK